MYACPKSPRSERWNENAKQLRESKYLEGVLIEDIKCDSEIQRHVRIPNDAFQKLSKVLRNGNISLETEKVAIKCYLITIVLYGSGWFTMERKPWY